MIVSGSYFGAHKYVLKWKTRQECAAKLAALLEEYYSQLRDYRKPINEFFEESGSFGNALISDQKSDALTSEENEILFSNIAKIKSASFEDALKFTDTLKNQFSQLALKLEKELATSGKAIPMVSASLGVLLAILLF